MDTSAFGDPLLDPLFTTAEAAAIFSPLQRLQGMLDFEAALARAQARVGVIPRIALVWRSVTWKRPEDVQTNRPR